MARTILLTGGDAEIEDVYASFRERTLKTIKVLKDGVSLMDAKRQYYSEIKTSEDLIILTGPLLHGVGIVNYELPKLDHPFEGRGYPETIVKA